MSAPQPGVSGVSFCSQDADLSDPEDDEPQEDALGALAVVSPLRPPLAGSQRFFCVLAAANQAGKLRVFCFLKALFLDFLFESTRFVLIFPLLEHVVVCPSSSPAFARAHAAGLSLFCGFNLLVLSRE